MGFGFETVEGKFFYYYQFDTQISCLFSQITLN